jgi:hypothetical protein
VDKRIKATPPTVPKKIASPEVMYPFCDRAGTKRPEWRKSRSITKLTTNVGAVIAQMTRVSGLRKRGMY